MKLMKIIEGVKMMIYVSLWKSQWIRKGHPIPVTREWVAWNIHKIEFYEKRCLYLYYALAAPVSPLHSY